MKNLPVNIYPDGADIHTMANLTGEEFIALSEEHIMLIKQHLEAGFTMRQSKVLAHRDMTAAANRVPPPTPNQQFFTAVEKMIAKLNAARDDFEIQIMETGATKDVAAYLAGVHMAEESKRKLSKLQSRYYLRGE